jgi:hypothetical protein
MQNALHRSPSWLLGQHVSSGLEGGHDVPVRALYKPAVRRVRKYLEDELLRSFGNQGRRLTWIPPRRRSAAFHGAV